MFRNLAAAIAAIFLAAAPLLPASASPAHLPAEERFDGSFRLDNGSIITGGKFVEGPASLWIYLDTNDTSFGSAFGRIGDSSTFRSLAPPGTATSRKIELEFIEGPGGAFDRLVWRENGKTIKGKRVFAHSSREISFPSFDGAILKGRLVEPLCSAPGPAVVAVHGSGPASRYGGPFDLFFVRQGLAVLAYDKRGLGADSKWVEPDIEVLSRDVASAVRFLAAQPRIDGKRIGLFGSSQGGWTAPMGASVGDQVGFLILRAGAAISQQETFVHEKRQEWRADGLSGLDLDNATALLDSALTLARLGRPIDDADKLAAPFLATEWYQKAIGKGKVSENWSPNWWGYVRRNMGATSIPAIEKSGASILWFLAERDEAVPLVATRAALEQAFAKSPSADETIVTIAGARHNFIVDQDGKPAYAPDFFRTMEAWLKARGLSRPGCQARK